jgi:ATP-binding cassette subfamily B protein
MPQARKSLQYPPDRHGPAGFERLGVLKSHRRQSHRRLFAHEVIQTSALDCGAASLKSLLEGFGIHASYGRLRELCQTSLDGASIDTIEEVAGLLGLEAEQIMLPVDHLFAEEARALPAMVVVRNPSGVTHFVVAWRLHGGLLQVMDPGVGRRWPRRRRFLEDLYIHTQPVAAADWRAWAGTEELLAVLRLRLERLGVSPAAAAAILDAGRADASWCSLAAADAATRMVQALVDARGLRRGSEAQRLVGMLAETAAQEAETETQTVPPAFWSVRPTDPGPDGEERLDLRGAVMLRVRGKRSAVPAAAAAAPEPLRRELDAVVGEPPPRPLRAMLRHLRRDLAAHGPLLAVAVTLSSAAVLAEAMLFRGLIDLGADLGAAPQRLGAVGFLLLFLVASLLLEMPIGLGLMRLGRHLEGRLRMVVAEKIPRIADAYFRSRLASDMAERFHNVHLLRLLPAVGGGALRSGTELLLTAAGIVWLDPASGPIALCALLLAVGVPLGAQPLLAERDLRVRSHTGGLARYYLDALLGLVAIRSHRAEPAVTREHEGLLVEWVRAGRRLLRGALAAEGLQLGIGYGMAAWLLATHLERHGEAGGVLLLVYWALKLPALGGSLALSLREYPIYRNISLRIDEPLGAPDEVPPEVIRELAREAAREAAQGVSQQGKHGAASRGVGLSLSGVTVRAAGHVILEDVDLEIEAGARVAVVGPSGAGKSTLMGLFLGWHRPWEGRLEADGQPLDAARWMRLRRQTAWIDPSVQLWNRTLLENLFYGASETARDALWRAVREAELTEVLEDLPDGFQTALGEGGALLSGGQGQRVRLARGMLRPDARLVILDEAFRGLDRRQRHGLLDRVRRWWPDATMLYVTHDLGETRSFDRVVVIVGGRVVETAAPEELAGRVGGRYRALLDAEEATRRRLAEGARWRRLQLAQHRLTGPGGAPP